MEIDITEISFLKPYNLKRKLAESYIIEIKERDILFYLIKLSFVKFSKNKQSEN